MELGKSESVISDPSGGYSNEHNIGHSDEHSIGYSDEHSIGYSDGHSIGYSDDHSIGYSDEHSDSSNTISNTESVINPMTEHSANTTSTNTTSTNTTSTNTTSTTTTSTNRREAFQEIIKLFPDLNLDVDEVMFNNDIQALNTKIEEAKINIKSLSPELQHKIEAAAPNHFATYMNLRDELCKELPVYSCVKNIVKNMTTSKYIKMNPLTDYDTFENSHITDWYLDFEDYDVPLELKNTKHIIYDKYGHLGLVHVVN